MGSADASIVYGLPFAGEGFDFDDSSYHEDVEKWLCENQGLSEPEGDYETNAEDRKAYWDARGELPIVLDCSGDISNDITAVYLCIRASRISADWGCGVEIPVDHIKPPPAEWDDLLRAFCEQANIPFEQPKWYLLVNYG